MKFLKIAGIVAAIISCPINAMLLVMDMEKMIGNDFETGLRNLKEILESK